MLDIAQHGPVRVLTLNRPEAMNAISTGLANLVLEAVRDAEADPATRTVVIAAAGEKAFCTGADLKERRTFNAEQKWAHTGSLWRINEAIWNSPKAFLAAIHGWCLGGGFELALYCDMRVAAPDARFGFPEMTLGAFPGAGGGVILPRLIGRAAARGFFYEARRVAADEALRLGIVDEVVPRDQLLSAVIARAARVAESTSPLGLGHVKQLLNRGAVLPVEAAVALHQSLRQPLEASEDYAEGLKAHFEKRKPRFVGR